MNISTSFIEQIDVSSFRKGIRKILDQVLQSGKRRVITRHGEPVAALVPIGDLRSLRALEQQLQQKHSVEKRKATEPLKYQELDEALSELFDSGQPEDEVSERSVGTAPLNRAHFEQIPVSQLMEIEAIDSDALHQTLVKVNDIVRDVQLKIRALSDMQIQIGALCNVVRVSDLVVTQSVEEGSALETVISELQAVPGVNRSTIDALQKRKAMLKQALSQLEDVEIEAG